MASYELEHFTFFKMADSGHFEFHPLAEFAVTFERCMGANFSVKWFRLTDQSREKVGKE